MKEIKSVGNYLQCPYCHKLFGNGISVVFTDIVKDCSCEGMRQAVKIQELEKLLKSTK